MHSFIFMHAVVVSVMALAVCGWSAITIALSQLEHPTTEPKSSQQPSSMEHGRRDKYIATHPSHCCYYDYSVSLSCF